MSKDHTTPREQLVCGKLDALTLAIQSGATIDALDLVESIRRDCQRMESKLVRRKAEVERLENRIAGMMMPREATKEGRSNV